MGDDDGFAAAVPCAATIVVVPADVAEDRSRSCGRLALFFLMMPTLLALLAVIVSRSLVAALLLVSSKNLNETRCSL